MTWGVLNWPEGSDAAKNTEKVDADYPECDYDKNVTTLYEAIEDRAWIAVNQFLHSGYWPETLFADSMSPYEQARTWVTRYENKPDGTRKVRWSQLPLHAAVIFGAPSVVIQQLVEVFPQSVRCTDDHRMLPIHLAFRHGSPDSVLAVFLEEFPEAVNVRGYKNRLPVECAQKGPNPERGAIIETILKKNQSSWQSRKSAVHLMELYCIKEALKIKVRKVSHLEMAMKEIKYREMKTKKELTATMQSLMEMKARKQQKSESSSEEEEIEERAAVKELVAKLAALEQSTKDLIHKETRTKEELKKTLVELEALKDVKPTEEQAENFAKLEQVASIEGPNMLYRDPSDQTGGDEAENEKSSDEGAPRVQSIDPREMESASEPTSKSPSACEPPSLSPSVTSQAFSTEMPKEVSETKLEKSKNEAEEDAHVDKASERQVATENAASEGQAETKSAALDDEDKQESLEDQRKQVTEDQPVPVSEDESEPLTHEQPKVVTGEQPELQKVKKKSAAKKIFSLFKRVMSKKNDVKGETTIDEAGATTTPVQADEGDEESEGKHAVLDNVQNSDEKPNPVEEMENSAVAAQVENSEDPAKDVAPDENMGTDEGAEQEVAPLAEAKETAPQVETIEMIVEDDPLSIIGKKLQEGKGFLDRTLELAMSVSPVASSKGFVAFPPAAFPPVNVSDKSNAPVKSEENTEVADGKQDLPKSEGNTDIGDGKQDSPKPKDEATKKDRDIPEDEATKRARGLSWDIPFLKSPASKEETAEKLAALERVNKELEDKINVMESNMKAYEEQANITKEELVVAVRAVEPQEQKLNKKQEKQMAALETAMKKLEERANATKEELEKANAELKELKSNKPVVSTRTKEEEASDKEALDELAKKVVALQSAVVGFEGKEQKNFVDLEQTLKQIETVSDQRFEILSAAAQHSTLLATDAQFSKDVSKLEKKADKEEKRLIELESMMKDLESKGTKTVEELNKTVEELENLKMKQATKETPTSKAAKKETEDDKRAIKELTKKVSSLQSAIVGFEVKETKTMKELEHTMRQLEELTSKRFEVLERGFSKQQNQQSEKMMSEDKIGSLSKAMKDLETVALRTKEELETTKQELEELKTQPLVPTLSKDSTKEDRQRQECQIAELNEKISALQAAVLGFEVKETKTLQELEQTMKQLEELTSKRFEVLQKVAGREIEAARLKEANKLGQKAARDEKKVAALEFAMRELESKAYKTRITLEKTTKALERMEEKQTSKHLVSSQVTNDDKRVMRELVSKVAEIQEAVMNYDEKETKTIVELEKTKKELEETKAIVEELRGLQLTTTITKTNLDEVEESVEVATVVDDPAEASKADDKDDSAEARLDDKKRAAETGSQASGEQAHDAQEGDAQTDGVQAGGARDAQTGDAQAGGTQVTEETLNTLEQAIVQLVDRLGSQEEGAEGDGATATEQVDKASKDVAKPTRKTKGRFNFLNISNKNEKKNDKSNKNEKKNEKKQVNEKKSEKKQGKKKKLFGVFGPRNRTAKKESEKATTDTSKLVTNIGTIDQREDEHAVAGVAESA